MEAEALVEYISYVDLITKFDLNYLSFLGQTEGQEYNKIKKDLENPKLL